MKAPTHVLQGDTQAILLLCSWFGQFSQPKPLSISEYSTLAQKLNQKGLRPADLLSRGESWILDEFKEDLGTERIVGLLKRDAMLAFAVEDWTNKGLWILSRSDQAYPQRLKRKLQHLSPPILYGVGNQDLLSKGGLAIVGSRDIDSDGHEYTRRIAEKCVEQDIQVVSGGARGVDQTAMLAAIGVGGSSVGVLADSLTKASVSSKYREGLRQGRVALVSPYDPSVRFLTGNAMSRNKHVYALADYALVVDSSYKKGGTWAGAKEELNQKDRIPVLVRLQGSTSQGNQELHKLGAIDFPPEPWNRNIVDLIEEAKQIKLQKNASRQLEILQPKHEEEPPEKVSPFRENDDSKPVVPVGLGNSVPSNPEHIPQAQFDDQHMDIKSVIKAIDKLNDKLDGLSEELTEIKITVQEFLHKVDKPPAKLETHSQYPADLTTDQLRKIAKDKRIKGYSKLRKKELVESILENSQASRIFQEAATP